MGDLVDLKSKKSSSNKSEKTEVLYKYHIVHRRLINDQIEYVDTFIEGAAVGIGPNYIAVASSNGPDSSAVFICTLDMLDSIVREDKVVNE